MTKHDFDGDGRYDLLAVQFLNNKFFVYRSTGSKFLPAEVWKDEGFDYSRYLFLVANVSGNGRADIVAICPDANPPVPESLYKPTLRIVVWPSKGNEFDNGEEWRKEENDYRKYLFFTGDANGDGRDDIIAVRPEPLRIAVFVSKDSGFDGQEWREETEEYKEYSFGAGDVNGDGKVDIIAVRRNSLDIIVWLSDGKRFVSADRWRDEPFDYSAYRFFVADVTGDGKADIIAILPNPLRIVVWESLGSKADGGFAGGKEWKSETQNYSDYTFTLGDVDANGKADIIATHETLDRIVVWKSLGDRFADGDEWYVGPPVPSVLNNTIVAGQLLDKAFLVRVVVDAIMRMAIEIIEHIVADIVKDNHNPKTPPPPPDLDDNKDSDGDKGTSIVSSPGGI